VVIARGDIFWADLGEPSGSRPAKRRPVLVIQADAYNQTSLTTVIVAVITSNTKQAAFPGNTFLPAALTGLPRDSVVNVTTLYTLNRDDLVDRAGLVAGDLLRKVNQGLRHVLDL
jgi:mRNA interferase MazF